MFCPFFRRMGGPKANINFYIIWRKSNKQSNKHSHSYEFYTLNKMELLSHKLNHLEDQVEMDAFWWLEMNRVGDY